MMMTSKTKKKRSDSFFASLRHPFSPFNHLTFVRARIALTALACFASLLAANPARATPAFQSSKTPHAHDFVIFTTVFTDQGLALYGARTRLRRMDEKKFRWEASSDHQGELAFRVPQGAQYEMIVEARGFKAQTRKIDATQDLRTDLIVRMEAMAGSSAAPHPEPSTGGKP
jgi:hypothetical protein